MVGLFIHCIYILDYWVNVLSGNSWQIEMCVFCPLSSSLDHCSFSSVRACSYLVCKYLYFFRLVVRRWWMSFAYTVNNQHSSEPKCSLGPEFLMISVRLEKFLCWLLGLFDSGVRDWFLALQCNSKPLLPHFHLSIVFTVSMSKTCERTGLAELSSIANGFSSVHRKLCLVISFW